MKRREFLTLAGGAATAAAIQGNAAARGRAFLGASTGVGWPATNAPTGTLVEDRGYARIWRLADGVYATIADPSKGLQCASNGGLIVGREAVLIIEGHMQPVAATMQIEIARKLTTAPIRGAVNTHFHLDHTFGNYGYAQEKVSILAHERVTELMKRDYASPPWIPHSPQQAEIEKEIAAAKDATEKQRKEGDLGFRKWMDDSIKEVKLTYPTELLRTSELPKTIDLGGLTAVIEYHPGHSPSDLIIRVPERDVVYTGDLLFNKEYPVTLDADMGAWRRVLDLFAAYDKKTQFIPGHGNAGNRAAVAELADLFDDWHAHAEKMMKSGATVEEAEERYTLPKRFESGPMLGWRFTVGDAMRSYYKAAGRTAS